MQVTNQALWQKGQDAQKSGYGRAINTYAERWADLMESEMAQGHKLEDIAKRTSHEANKEGISGFMYGTAVSRLAQVWVHGESLRRWHNGEYDAADSDGVVNPAVIYIETE